MKKLISVFLLFVLLLTACGETNVDTSSQDISSEIVSQESREASFDAEISSADVSSESEETPSYVYARKGEESLFVEDAKEIIESFKTKYEDFENKAKRAEANFNPVSNSLIQVYEYTLEEYAETGKIEPRATNSYYYRDRWFIYENEYGFSIHHYKNNDSRLYSFKELANIVKTMQINPETMKATLVEITDLGLYYYVDDGEKQILIGAKDLHEGGYHYCTDNAAMLLLYDTTDLKPAYNCILLNDATQLRAKGIVADEEEYSQMLYGNPTTGGKGWDDKTVLGDYFRKIVDEGHIQEFGELIDPKHMQYFGESNGWRIYHVVYVGQIYDAAYFEMDLGGYTFKCNGIFSPSAPAIYAIKRKEVLTLKEAYEKGKIDVKEVYEFTPDEYKR